ncbi:MAG: hypothetical protein RIE06_11785 [Roseibium album]|uniref:hypothetical protein n=1 Tax=Roseibium album TaxID=311410 RepID=UPI0032EDA4C9
MVEQIIGEQAASDPTKGGDACHRICARISVILTKNARRSRCRKNRAAGKGFFEPVSRSRVQPGCRGFHQSKSPVSGQVRFRCGSAFNVQMEQLGTLSCAVDGFSIDDVWQANLSLTVEKAEGFAVWGMSLMKEIGRNPEGLVLQADGRHHQYQDGFMPYLGTAVAPTQDRNSPGGGITNMQGGKLVIASPAIGSPANTVRLSTECPEWIFGVSQRLRIFCNTRVATRTDKNRLNSKCSIAGQWFEPDATFAQKNRP